MEKAVILARGLGSRMRHRNTSIVLDEQEQEVADTGIKALIPIGRPFLDYVLSGLADAGYRRVCLIIGPEHEAIRKYYGEEVNAKRVSIEFAVQEEPKGTADAVAAAEAFADGDPFVMLNSDNYVPSEVLEQLRHVEGNAVALFDWKSLVAESNLTEQRLKRFAVGVIDSEGCLSRVLEKPDDKTWNALPHPIWLSMNVWRFGPAIFEACKAIVPSPRGEYEITDAVQYMIDNLGQRFHAMTVRAPVLDLTSREDIAPVKERLSHVEVIL